MMLSAFLSLREQNTEITVTVKNPSVFYHAAFGKHHHLAATQNFGGKKCQQSRLVVGYGTDATQVF